MKYNSLNFITLIVVLLAGMYPVNSTFGQSQAKFEHLTIDDGLSQNSVECLLQDSDGFIWMGTQDGLNRYDGYGFTVFKHDPDNPNSLSNNLINSLYEDRAGYLWIGTNSGLNRMDRTTGKIIRIKDKRDKQNDAKIGSVFSILEDHRGIFWVGTRYGLFTITGINEGSWQIARLRPRSPAEEILDECSVLSMLQDPQRHLWIATNKGLLQLTPGDDDGSQSIHYQTEPENSRSLNSTNLNGIVALPDEPGVLWISTADKGLCKMDTDNDGKVTFTRYIHNPNNPHSLSSDVLLSIHLDRNGILWIATGNGLNKFDSETGLFKRYFHHPDNPLGLSSNNILSLMEDRSGVLWIGTQGGGVNKLDTKKRQFDHYWQVPNRPQSLVNNQVWAIFEDHRGKTWIGTSDGLTAIDFSNREFPVFRNYTHEPQNPNSLPYNFIISIYESPNEPGVLWLGTWGAGLIRMSQNQKGKIRYDQFLKNPGKPNDLGGNYVLAIYEDPDEPGLFWIATNTGLSRMRRSNDNSLVFQHFRHDPDNPNSISFFAVSCVYKDVYGTMWIGTYKGLTRMSKNHRGEWQFTRFYHEPGNPNSLNNNNVSDIWGEAHDQSDRSENVLWIATSGGLTKLIEKRSEVKSELEFTFTNYTEKQGLCNNTVMGIVDDNHFNLWLPTNHGLSTFNPRSETFRNYYAENGLQSNEFNARASYKNNKDEIIVGGVNGFNIFHPDSIKDNPHIPPVVITNFRKYNEMVKLDTTVHSINEIVLSYEDQVFSFEFAALDYSAPENNQFAYKLLGFNDRWIDLGNKHEATFTNLDPGEYTLRVKGSNNDGVWNDEGASLKIIITPPFWQTWWFRITLLCIIVLSLIYWHRSRVYRVEKQRRKLEREVNNRTSEIRQKNVEIQSQAEELRKTNRKLIELDGFKKNMTSMIVHDLKNPLNTIIGLSGSDIKTGAGRNINQYSKQMLNLVMNILDVHKFEDTRMKIDLVDGSLYETIHKALDQVNFLVEKKSLKVENWVKQNCTARMNADLIERVFVNLLTNAIKYSPLNGKIIIKCEDDKEYFRLSVSDEGPGIPPDKMKIVFRKYGQVHAMRLGISRSTGLGLTFCKMVVEAHHGKIGVNSEIKKGSTFWFTLQKGQNQKGLPEISIIKPKEKKPLKLSKEETKCIQQVLEQLENLEVFEVTDLRKVIKQIKTGQNSNLQKWKEQIEEAVFSGNEEKYNELINP